MPASLDTIMKFTTKLNDNAKGLKDPTKMIVDPGKFGRVASRATDAEKYAVCRILNPIFAARGCVTTLEVAAAFDKAGL